MKKLVSSAALSCALFLVPGGLSVMTTLPAVAQEANVRVLTVTGRGREPVQTTLAAVGLGVTVQGRTAAEVQQQLAQKASTLVAFLRDRTVSNLQTTRIRLEPQYSYDSGIEEFVGYTGSNNVSFELPTDQVGQLLDEAIARGANRIDYINFTASDEAMAAARDAALVAATADAQNQARTVLQALNLNIEEIIGIAINEAGSRIPGPISFARQEVAADFETPVVGGEQIVDATVTLEIRY